MATSLPASFSNNTSPTGVQLDNNFAAVASMAIWNCTATGTNAIALTVTANQPNVSAYTDRQRFQFVAAASSNGSVTVAVNSLSALPLYLISGTQAASGDVSNGTPYLIIYLSALNSGGGGFQILSSVLSSAVVAAATGSVRGLLMTNNTSTPSTKIDITSGQATLVTTGGSPKFISSASVTIDLTTTGANGMDTGARPTSGYVYCYLISNGSVTAGLATATSPSAGNPMMPGGYTFAAYCGAMFCDGSQNLLRTRQAKDWTQYQITSATNTASLGFCGFTTGATFNPFSLGTLAPSLVASEIGVVCTSNSAQTAAVSPNNNVAISSTPSAVNPPLLPQGANTAGTTFSGRILLESATFYAAIVSGSLGVLISGWRDRFSSG